MFFRNEKIDVNELRATVCHELLRPNCHEHTGKWIEYAKKIDDVYGYEISEYKTEFDLKNKHMPVVHRLRCSKCGGYWNIRKEGDWERVQNGGKGICAWCGNYYTIDF